MKDSSSELKQPLPSWKVSPFWRAARIREYPRLTADVQCDVAIIGGGIVGVAAALKIGSENSRVMLFERGQIAEGSSGFSAGMISLTTTVDLRIIENSFGRKMAAALYTRLSDAVENTLSQVRKYMDADALQEGVSIYAAAKKSHLPILEAEQEIRTEYGMPTKLMSKDQLPQWLKNFHGALLLENERGVNPVRLVESIAKRASEQGCEIFENTEITAFEHKQDGEGYFLLKSGNYTVKARHLLIATGVHGKRWSEKKSVERLLVPVRGDIIVTAPSPEVARIVKDEGAIAMWDTYQMLYVYMRYLADGRILAGGADSPGTGEPRIKSADDENIKRLHAVIASRHNFPIPPVDCAWQASFSLPADGLPILKQSRHGANRLVIASTDGLPSGILLGEVIADIMAGRKNEVLPMLEEGRERSLDARLLALMPDIPVLRNLSLKLVFMAMRLKDILS